MSQVAYEIFHRKYRHWKYRGFAPVIIVFVVSYWMILLLYFAFRGKTKRK